MTADLGAIRRRLSILEADMGYVGDWIEWDDCRVLLDELQQSRATEAELRARISELELRPCSQRCDEHCVAADAAEQPARAEQGQG